MAVTPGLLESSNPHDLFVSPKILPPANPREKTEKAAFRTLRNLFRLETTPFLCFVNFTRSFNCTHVSVRTTSEANEKRTARRPSRPEKPSAPASRPAPRHPSPALTLLSALSKLHRLRISASNADWPQANHRNSEPMAEQFLPAPEPPEQDGFNPHATIPFGVTTEHLYESMKEFITFVGFIDAQLRAQKMALFEDILMAANFNSMVGEFMT